MGYAHTLWGLDLSHLTLFFGSKKEELIDEMVSSMEDEFEDNDAFFEDEIDDGTCPSTEEALRHIARGEGFSKDSPAMYGYALQVMCQHIGQLIEHDDIAAVRDHPYQSALETSGPPIDIPYDQGDFPEIGFIPFDQIEKEIALIDATPAPADEEIAEDVDAYREALQWALDNKLSVVSFRH